MTIGKLTLPNRLAMAPMTRDRAQPDGSPTELNATYYAQRASFGLIISEATQPSDDGQGYLLTPGIYTDAHVAGWKLVIDRVHEAGGRLFVQLMHVGRISHPANTPHGRQPVAPSAVKPAGKMFTMQGMLEMPEPRALTEAEIASTIADFRHAAKCAIDAGADGVEIHGANGYLIQQFLAENTNLRTDAYGGSIENRVRFALEVAKAVAEEIGPERTGFRISPLGTFNDIAEGDSQAIYHALIAGLAPLGLAYLHVLFRGNEELLTWMRGAWPTALILNRPGRARETIAADIESGLADVVSVGTFALANPDLVARLKSGAAFNTPDQSTFYGGGEHGYTDYPALSG
jgi:N-ethylmaleimide reductase